MFTIYLTSPLIVIFTAYPFLLLQNPLMTGYAPATNRNANLQLHKAEVMSLCLQGLMHLHSSASPVQDWRYIASTNRLHPTGQCHIQCNRKVLRTSEAVAASCFHDIFQVPKNQLYRLRIR